MSSPPPPPSVPVIIQLEEPPNSEEPSTPSKNDFEAENDKISQAEVENGNVLSTRLLGGSLSAPSSPSSSLKMAPPPVSKSLLGADLFQKPGSLVMPPPSSNKVKKARNLVNPGMSMVNWMKLQDSRQRPNPRRKIPLVEVANHNTESDCWMVIRNCVYDVTEYLPYHPGGVPELMKGAGKDATALFNEIHRWVNFESILKSCFKGYLSDDSPEESLKLVLAPKALTPPTGLLPKTKFFQNESDLTLLVEVPSPDENDISEDHWIISILNRERLLLKLIRKPPELWMAHVKLCQSLNDDKLSVDFQNSWRRALITFKKPAIGTWKSLGSALPENNRVVDSREAQLDDFCHGTVVEKEELNSDVILLGIQPSSSTILGVPVGFHLRLRLHSSDNPDLLPPARKYTPVLKSLKSLEDTGNNGKVLYFIIKIYPEGLLTKHLGQLAPPESSLELGNVAGRYDPAFLRDCETLLLLAGGSGITPFVRIVDFLRKRKETYPIRRILLVFFNHTANDIIWREEWEELASSWENFYFYPVITSETEDSDSDWKGLRGRISARLLESVWSQTVNGAKLEVGKCKAMICGSSGFNDACVTVLKSLPTTSVTDEDVFIF